MRRFNLALVAFIDTDGHILLNRRNDSTREAWELIGGSIETAESPLDAIKREVKEELCYQFTEADELTFVERLELTSDDLFADVHFFTARYPGIEYFSDSSEVTVDDLKLFSRTEALSLPLLPITENILQAKTFEP